MTKNKMYILIGVTGAVGILLLFSIFYILAGQRNHNIKTQGSENASSLENNQQTVAGSTVPLPTSQKSKGSPGAALGTNSTKTTPGNRQLNVQNNGQSAPLGSNQNTAPAKTQQNPFDPSTFSQYDKYKNDTAALAGEVLAGDGATLEAGKKASVYYRGWLTNGTMFDQSRTDANGQLQTFSFTLGAHQVITGWEQALAGMKVGAVRLLIIPPSVGYGSSGQGSIPPNSVLVFQVQLVAVE